MTPECCSCGNTDFAGCDMRPFYTHQQIELPKIEMEISHFIFHQCSCPECGKAVKAGLPEIVDRASHAIGNTARSSSCN